MARSFIIARVLRILGIIIIAGTGYFLYEEHQFNSHARTTEGILSIADKARADTYFITFYPTPAQRIYLKSSIRTDNPAYHENDTIQFRYHPDYPDRIHLNTFWSQWGIIILTLFGVVTFFTGFFMTKRLQSRRKAETQSKKTQLAKRKTV